MNTEQKDERRGHTSASNAAADRLCPGRHLANRGLEETESAEASQGTLIHAVFAGEKAELILDPMSAKTLRRAIEIESIILGNWLCGIDVKGPAECHREKRLWNYVETHSGQADAFWIVDAENGKHALLEDLKSLYGDHDDADENEQLRDLAALIYCNYGVQSVTAFINQPNVAWRIEDVKLVRYSEKDLMRAYREMCERVLASNDPNAKRIVGPKQCKFCKAAGTARCPESQKALVTLGTAQFEIETASPEERADWLEKLTMIEKMAAKCIAELKDGIRKNGNGWAEGWGLGKAKKTREIQPEKIPLIGATLAAHFDCFETVELARCCKISVPKLQELHAKLSDLKGKQAFDHFEQLFSELIETTEQQQPVQKLK
jgi:hypothetical protein